MADSRFFANCGPFTLQHLADVAAADLSTGADKDRLFHDVAPLDRAGGEDVSFLDNPRYLDQFKESAAGACVVHAKHAHHAPEGMITLVSDRPYRSYALVAQAFYGDPAVEGERHGSAHIDETAQLGNNVDIGPGAVIGRAAVLGDRVRIGANTVIGPGVVIGDDSEIGPNATLTHCEIGARTRLHPGVRIGQRGFGFDMAPDGHLDVPQLGCVFVGDDVEIGANSTVDRGAGPDTIIGDGCKIDNLVQIGHNVQLGRGCVIIAQAGLSGSAHLEDLVVIAGQAGVAGHIRIGTGTQLAARSGLMRDTPAGSRMAGNPAIPAREFFRQFALLGKLAKSGDNK